MIYSISAPRFDWSSAGGVLIAYLDSRQLGLALQDTAIPVGADHNESSIIRKKIYMAVIYGSWRRCDKGSSCMSGYAFFFLPYILSEADLGQDSVTILESLRGQTSHSYSRHQCTRCSRSHGDVNSLLFFFSP